MLRLLLVFIICCTFALQSKTQNLVPNPSFEEYDNCPSALSQISRATGWYSAKPSPDYYHSCAFSSSSVSIPDNYFGYQYPSTGDAYAGFAAMYGGVPNLREFIGIKLSDTLYVGTKYYVSFRVSRAFNPTFINDCSVNKIGALFSTVQYSDTNNAPVCNCSQVYTDVIVRDSLNWTMIKGSFIADSNYCHINIGNFFTNAFTDSIQIDGAFCNAYYYVDNVCVSNDSAYAYNYSFTGMLGANSQLNPSIYPNPAFDFIYVNCAFLSETYNIHIYDDLGKEVFLKENIINPVEHVPIHSISSNILFVRISYKNRTFNFRVLKVKQ